MTSQRVAADVLARVMSKALQRRGLDPVHIDFVVDSLIETSLRAVDTHGVTLLPTYLQELDGGRARARPELAWSEDASAVRILNAGGALGIVAGRVAAEEAVRLAKGHGIGAVFVRDSNHFGAASCYTLAMARRDVIGLSFSNSDALVAPFRGILPIFGTNPLSVAARGEGEDMFCLDMATSQSSFSRLLQRQQQGLAPEPGWATDSDGRDLCDSPAPMVAMQPLGGYKGQGLAMMVELLCTVLIDMPLDSMLSHLYRPPYDTPRQIGHCFVAIDVAPLPGSGGFRGRLSGWMRQVRAQPGAAGQRVLVPGDLEREAHSRRLARGIPLPEPLLRQLRQINEEAPAAEREPL